MIKFCLIMKMYGIGFFIVSLVNFFLNFTKLMDRFSKKTIPINTNEVFAHYLVSFYPNPLSKVCGMKFLTLNFLNFFSILRDQTVHWIGAQFCVCMFLDSRDKPLNILKLCRNDQRKVKNKRRTKGASLLRNPLTMHKMHSLAS